MSFTQKFQTEFQESNRPSATKYRQHHIDANTDGLHRLFKMWQIAGTSTGEQVHSHSKKENVVTALGFQEAQLPKEKKLILSKWACQVVTRNLDSINF